MEVLVREKSVFKCISFQNSLLCDTPSVVLHIPNVLTLFRFADIVHLFQTKELPKIEPIKDAQVLLHLGDSVTTDHISPAGSIARNSAAARYLADRGYGRDTH